MRRTPIYNVWSNMIQRCENPNCSSYKWYGGRGIKVCERWHKFENFYADVGNPPEGMTLDRYPDNNGDYEPDNWRWATINQQRNNTSKQKFFCARHKDSIAQYICNNQTKFAQKHKLDATHISACLRGKRKQHKGWTFQHFGN